MSKIKTIGYECESCDTTFFAPNGFPDVLPDRCRNCLTEQPWEKPNA